MSSIHGNLIIGQSGGATAVINASLVGAVEAAMQQKRIGNIYGMLYGVEGLLKEDIIDLRRQPAECRFGPRRYQRPDRRLGRRPFSVRRGK